MPNNKFDDIAEIVQTKRDELIDKLVSFVSCDTILFLPENADCCLWVKEANHLLGTDFVMSDGLKVSEFNINQMEKIRAYLLKCSILKETWIYLTATELRSVLLAILVAEKRIGVEDAFSMAFYEELTQQNKWGTLSEIEQRHREIKKRLQNLEQWADERSLSKN
mgnify:CR=1 FL=1